MSNLEMKVNALCAIILCEGNDERAAARDALREMMCEANRSKEPAPKPGISNVLLEIGVPDHVKGHRYLARALEYAVEDREILDNITKVLYPKVAEDFDTTPSRVERAIRHAIEIGWDRANLDVLTKYFGNTVSCTKGKPTNSEFIARIANVLR